ncbi:NUDIX hydrolase [Haloarchaeobius sp. HRN-SO-5]|uniref:NUDIX hydrolase n=1 Tax=Haloarchaeobius sp. HRN-SO-5 TaxID=3446118 RepID=UPI003EB889A8
MTVDDLWYRARRASQAGQQAYHRLRERHPDAVVTERIERVGRHRFRRLVGRIDRSGAPFGSHTIVYRPSADILLVRHEGVDLWVVPGGGVHEDETFREAAERELAEEAGVEATYDGLAILTRVEVVHGDRSVEGVLPVYAARAETDDPHVADPDDEISAARWFETLPDDTRDRDSLVDWRDRTLPV